MPQPGTLRALLLVALAAFVTTESAALAAGSLLRDRLDGQQIVVIGSGRSLSVLVTVGQARLLLAAGDDTTAFGNGWRRWAGFVPTPRVDVVLLAGNSAVGSSIGDRVRSRWTAAIGSPAPRQPEDHAPPLVSPLRFRLGDEVRVTVETAVEPGPTGDPNPWRVLVERGRTVVAVVPNGTAATRFQWAGPVAALIVLGDSGGDRAVAAVQPRALVVPHEVAGRSLRADVPPILTADVWSIRLPPGEIARLSFVESGLRIPSEAVPLTPIPTPDQTATRLNRRTTKPRSPDESRDVSRET